MDTALRIAGRVLAFAVTDALLILVALNIGTAWPDMDNTMRFSRGAATVYLLMLWFPSMRWKE